MTRRIGILNYKGGTGKTTTVVNLSAGLSRQDKRVLCVDMDAQGSLATYLGMTYRYSLAHLLLGQASAEECIIEARENLDIIASDSALLDAEGELWRMGNNQVARQVLSKRLRPVEDRYDYVLLDFSPSANILSENGLQYVRELIVPVAMSYLALVGTRQVVDTLKNINQVPGRPVKLYLIVPTFYNARTQQDREVLNLLKRYFGNKVTPPIRKNTKLTEVPSHHMTIYEYSPRCTGSIDYKKLAERVISDG